MPDRKTVSPRQLLARVAEALERIAPPPAPQPDLASTAGFTFDAARGTLQPVTSISRVPLALLYGIDAQRDILLANTQRFAAGLPANNALIWGARGMGKSALVKAVHASVCAEKPDAGLKIVEVAREDLGHLPALLALIRGLSQRIIVFCDDLSFDTDETTYKSLKAILEGGLEGRPANVVFYATSNRRHLMPREMMDNEGSTAINPGEAVEEKISLSDRFGLWLGIHRCDQADYLAMVEGYARHFGLDADRDALARAALEWAATRGNRSGRVAWQFIVDLAGQQGRRLGN